MVDKPDIVKKLREEEKLGKLESSSQVSHEDLEFLDDFPKESFEDKPDEVVDIGEEKTFTNHNDAETDFQILSEEKYRLIAEKTSDLIGIATFSLKPAYTYVNISLKKFLGYEQEELIGKNPLNFIHPDDKKNLTSILKKYLLIKAKKLLTGKKQEFVEKFECRLRDKSGNWHYVENTANLIGKEMLFVTKDITKRKKMEERLQESEEKFRTLYESATDAIMLLDENGFFDCNAATLKIFGLPSMNRFISKHPHDLSPPKQPDGKDSLAAFNEHIATAFEKGFDYFEWMHKCADGTIFPATVLLNQMKLKDRDILQAVVRDITEQKRKEKEIIKKNMDLKVAHDKLSSLNKNLEQKVKERTAEVEKILLQKDEFIGQLGHDLKNPLNPLVNLLPVLEEREHDSETKKIFEVLNRNVNHMRNLVFNTIELARLKSSNVKLNIENTNLLDEINNVIKMNNLLYEENNIEIENKTDKNIIVKTDKLRLTELFDNLIGNSVKYSPDGGTITIDAKQDKDFVTVSIKDTGKGMTEEQLSHMFDEFYKADEARHDFDSSGLGLPICKRIVEKQSGKIWAESQGEGKGTTMFFTLPTSPKNME
jgi:PAS domain S-box-containing protein